MRKTQNPRVTVSGRLREGLHQLAGRSHYAANTADKLRIERMARTASLISRDAEKRSKVSASSEMHEDSRSSQTWQLDSSLVKCNRRTRH